MAHLLGEESKDIEAKNETRLQNEMFGHAFMTSNPELYYKVYPPEDHIETLTEEQEANVEWEAPKTEADLQRMMGELAEVIGGPL